MASVNYELKGSHTASGVCNDVDGVCSCNLLG